MKPLHVRIVPLCLLFAVSIQPALAHTRKAAQIVADIKKADYAGDRPALKRLYDEIEPLAKDKKIAARVRYWRGFAMWRSALNGFNESVDPKVLEEELNLAVTEFDQSAAIDPTFVDARIAAASCLMNLTFLNQKDPAKVKEYVARFVPLMQEAHKEAPDNPRWYWAQGPGLWTLPVEYGGGQDKAFATYEKGLEVVHKQKPGNDPLEPTWGEAELLMNIAWSNLHRKVPDLKAADQYAHAALKLAPTWHYVRDILLPQIQDAQNKSSQCPTVTDGERTSS